MVSCCIIVCYRPDVARLLDLCDRILRDDARVVLVDNTEIPYLEPDRLPSGCTLIAIGYNSGIAHAQNVGIAAALEAGATALLFFDQDSRIEPGFVKSLTATLNEDVAEVVAPLCVDETTNMSLPALRVGRHGWSAPIHAADATTRYPVDVVISSGTAATRSAIEIAGTLDEDLFIDFVDTEWCLRCRARGVPIYVVPTVVMRHSIGNRYFRFGTFTILVHSAARSYYQIRNCFLLFRKSHVPIVFSLQQLASTLSSRAVLLFVVRGRLSYLKSYLFAVRDGLKGVTGAGPV